MEYPMNAIVEELNETRKRDFEKNMVRMTTYSMLQLIARRQIRCPQVFSWPMAICLLCITLFLVYEGSARPGVVNAWVMSVLFLLAFAAAVWVAIHEAKTALVKMFLQLQEVPQEKWLSVISVKQREPKWVTVEVRDLFGKFTKLRSHEFSASVRVPNESDELDVHKAFIASRLKPQWEDALNMLKKNNKAEE